jgi:hypothetical protein
MLQTILKLDDSTHCLCCLGRFKGSIGLQLYLENTFSFTRLTADQPDIIQQLAPDVALLGARDTVSLVALMESLRTMGPLPAAVVAMVDEYTEADVLELMHEGVTTVVTDYADLLGLKAALASAARQSRVLHEQQDHLRDVEATAHTALQAASEFGMLLRFLQESNTTTNLDSLLGVTIAFIRSMGLKGCVQALTSSGRKVMLSTDGEPSPIQLTLIGSLTERVVQKGRILGLSGTSTTWVCSGSELVDEAFSGRMRDILIQAIDILDARIRGLEMVELIHQQYTQVFDVIQLLHASLNDSQKATKHIMKRLALDIEQSAVSLDLNESQEASLLAISNSALEQMDQLFAGFGLLEKHFMSILSGLEKAQDLADASAGSNEVAGKSIELF